jgi:hypothetical protein
MIKVRKAGRPLTKCPHPKGACSCQRTYISMAKISKGNKPTFLSCRDLLTCSQARVIFADLYTKVSESQDDVSQSTPAYVPLMASPALGKVQKPERRESHFHLAPGTIAKALKYPHQCMTRVQILSFTRQSKSSHFPKLDGRFHSKSR